MPVPAIVAGVGLLARAALAGGARAAVGAAAKGGAKGATGAAARKGAARGAARGAAKNIRGGSTQGTQRSTSNRFSSISRSAGKSASRAASTPSPGSGGGGSRAEAPSVKGYVAPNLRGKDTGMAGYHGGINTGNSGLKGSQAMFEAESAAMQGPNVVADVMSQGKTNVSTATTATAWRNAPGQTPVPISKTQFGSFIKFE